MSSFHLKIIHLAISAARYTEVAQEQQHPFMVKGEKQDETNVKTQMVGGTNLIANRCHCAQRVRQ
ncbi:hypothetical protein D3C81_2003260 [compost metagenome]